MRILFYEGLDSEIRALQNKFPYIDFISNDLTEAHYKLVDLEYQSKLDKSGVINVCVVFKSKGIFKDSVFCDTIKALYDILKLYAYKDSVINFKIFSNNVFHKKLDFEKRPIEVCIYSLNCLNEVVEFLSY